MLTQQMIETLPIACDLDAIPAEHRATHILTAQQLFALAPAVSEIENGIELTLPGDAETFVKAAQFVAHERECCPFFTFTLEAKPGEELFRLRLTGEAQVKELLLAQFGDKLTVG